MRGRRIEPALSSTACLMSVTAAKDLFAPRGRHDYCSIPFSPRFRFDEGFQLRLIILYRPTPHIFPRDNSCEINNVQKLFARTCIMYK